MENEIIIKFGSRIRQLRLAKNYSQEELAFKAGFHRTYIGMIERGQRNPSLINIKRFADVFNIEIKDLFKDD